MSDMVRLWWILTVVWAAGTFIMLAVSLVSADITVHNGAAALMALCALAGCLSAIIALSVEK